MLQLLPRHDLNLHFPRSAHTAVTVLTLKPRALISLLACSVDTGPFANISFNHRRI